MKKLKVSAIFLVFILVTGCDIYRPQREFNLAIPRKDYFYNYMASHLIPFLEKNGYQINVIETATSIEANQLVAEDKADLCFINNHSIAVTEALGENAGRLRTVLPLTTRLLFTFTKQPYSRAVSAREVFENKRIGIELLGGEAQLNFERFLSRARIKGANIVTHHDSPDVIVFWGTFYGERAKKFMQEGWHPISFEPEWIDFLTLNEPALKSYSLPAIPGDSNSMRINTLAVDVILITNQNKGDNAIYELSDIIHKNKLALSHLDVMYRSIDDKFDQNALLFPLHSGTDSFIRRDQPTFFERYADTIALVLSILAVLYGGFQTIRNTIAKRRKDQVDKYFLEFLEIRQNKEVTLEQKVKNLDSLFHRAVEQMTNEKLEKSDFHILSRLIQQELTILRFND